MILCFDALAGDPPAAVATFLRLSRPSGHRGDRDLDRTVERVAPEELVDALTIRLAEKIKAELQLEDRAELGKVQAKVQREKANVNKLEGYLAKEIASHKCPICYEFCADPVKTTCGHFFCLSCSKHMMASGKNTKSIAEPLTISLY